MLTKLFNEINLDEMKSYGIDDVYCLSVNDAFVMRQVLEIVDKRQISIPIFSKSLFLLS